MLESMSQRAYVNWQRYYSMEPFGSIRDDYRFGSICATIFNTIKGALGGKKSDKQMQAHDFIPTYESVKEIEREEGVNEMNNGLSKAFAVLRAHAKL